MFKALNEVSETKYLRDYSVQRTNLADGLSFVSDLQGFTFVCFHFSVGLGAFVIQLSHISLFLLF